MSKLVRRPRRHGGVRWLPSVLAILSFCAASPTDAAPRKGDGDEGISAVRYQRERRKVEARSVEKPTPKRGKKDDDKGPGFKGDPNPREKIATSLAVTDDLIRTAKRLMEAAGPTDKDFPDYTYRLANLYLDKRSFYEMEVGKLYEVIHAHKQKGDKAKADAARAKQKRLEAEAKKAGQSAVKVLGALVDDKRFAGYKRMDEALYYYATELGTLGRAEDMQKAYIRLLQDFPTSQFRPQVYLSFADHKFQAGQIAQALELYSEIVKGYPNSPVYAFALYKIGWCHLNPVGTAPADYERSLQSFVAAINAANGGKAGNEANAKQLRREARRDLIKAYVHAAKPSLAWDFFGKVGNGPRKAENMQVKMMELLADAYYGEGKYVESSATYKTLQAELPKSDDVCTWQARVVENALATDDKSIQWKETKLLGERWMEFKDSGHGKTAKKKCRSDTLDALAQRATTWHDEADKTKVLDTYVLAREAYSEYLRLFPKQKDSYEMAYYLGETKWAIAEALYESKDRKTQDEGRAMFCDSADSFVVALEMKPKGKFTRDAALAQMLGWKNCTEYDETGGKGGACEPQSDGTCVYREDKRQQQVAHREDAEIDAATRFVVTEYSEKEQAMLDAYDRYRKYVDDEKDPELPKILYHRVKMMVEHNRFDEAVVGLDKLTKKFDGTRYSAWAAEMLLDIMTIKWADSANTPKQKLAAANRLLDTTKELQAMKLWKHAEATRLRKQAPDLQMAVRWTIAQSHCDQAKAGDADGFIDCGTEYHRIYEDFPEHDRGDELLYNAAIAFEAGYLVGNAIKLRNLLLDEHPDSKLHKKTLKMVAENYQAIAFYEQSADRLEQYADQYKGDEYAAQALNNAYVFRSGLGDDEAARKDLDRYESLYRRKDPGKAAEIYWSQADLIDDENAKLDHAEEFIKRYGKKGGKDRLIVAHAAAGQVLWRRSCNKKMLADACVTLKRKKAMSGEDARAEAEALRQVASRKLPERCGTATRGVMVVHDRDAKLAARAQKHFADAIAMGGKGISVPKDDSAREDAYLDAYAMALVYQADAKYEQYLRVEMPEGLDFHVDPWKKDSGVGKYEREYAAQVKRRDESVERFATFMKDKRALGNDLLEAYGKVGKIRSPNWVLAASARSAIVWQNFADQLYRAHVPKHFRTQDEVDSFCFELVDRAQPLEQMAVKAFEYCLDRSTKYQFFNDFSRMCEEELQQREPDRFPATNELFGTAEYTDARMDVVSVQTTLFGDRRRADTTGSKKSKKK